MGNNQSVEVLDPPTHRSSQKLVKPRTGSISASGILHQNSFSSSTLLFSSPRLNAALPERPATPPLPPKGPRPLPIVKLDPEELKARQQEELAAVEGRQGRRRSLFRSRSSKRGEQEKRSSSIGASFARVGERIGRSNSLTYESAIDSVNKRKNTESRPQPVSRASWAYNMTSYEAQRLIIEDQHDASPDSRISERAVSVAESRVKSPVSTTHTSPPPGDNSLGRANSDTSLCPPTRRRSLLQTPGVATRSESSAASSRPIFRYSQPPTPSLSRQQSFEVQVEPVGYLAMPPRIGDPASAERVVTPSDGDYKTIGAFKYGSLRITNGRASPLTPDLEKVRKEDAVKMLELPAGKSDYFSNKRLPSSSLAQVHSSAQDAQASYLLSPASDPVSPVDNNSNGGFLKATVQPFSGLDKDNSKPLPEIQLSPFICDDIMEANPALEATSKASAIEDHLFEDERVAELSGVEILDLRRDSNARQEPTTFLDLSSPDQGIKRTDSGIGASPNSDDSSQALTKADSGYSSNVSLRSFKDARAAKGPDFQKPDPGSSDPLPVAGVDPELLNPVVMTANEHRFSPVDRVVSPPLSPKQPSTNGWIETPVTTAPISRPQPQPTQKSFRHSLPAAVKRVVQTPPPLNTSESSEQPWQTPHSPDAPSTPTSTRSDRSSSALSIGSGPNRPNNLLQRLLSGSRRHSAGPPAVHIIHEFDSVGIPSVPRHVEARLHVHTGLYPMSTKRLALRTQGSKDTLKTIMSVGSLEVSKDEHVPPLPPMPAVMLKETATAIDEPQRRPKMAADPVATASAPTVFQIPRKPIKRKPVPVQSPAPEPAPVSSPARVQDEPNTDRRPKEESFTPFFGEDHLLPHEADLATYTSLNSALGKNAYDAAIMAMGADEKRKSRTMSMTVQLERNLTLETLTSPMGSIPSSPLLRSPSAQDFSSPTSAGVPKSTKSPPPVSMRTMKTRRSWGSRPTLPRRPTSTPVDLVGRPLQPKRVEVVIQDYPVVQGGNLTPESLGQFAPPPIPPMHPRRSIELMDHTAFLPQLSARPVVRRQPSWEVRTDHDKVRRAADHGRSYSLSAAGSQRSIGPPSEGPRRHPMQQPHRGASLGSYGGIQPGFAGPRSLPPDDRASLPTQSGMGGLPYDPSSFDWNTSGPYPQAPGQKKHRHSTGGPHDPPFRILHSYNSPAYRHVPIWN